MRIHWWQSIRWRLAIVSALLVLLATGVLALTATAVTGYDYGLDQGQIQAKQVQQLADQNQKGLEAALEQAQLTGKTKTAVIDNTMGELSSTITSTMPLSDQQFIVLIFGPRGMPIYPSWIINGVAGAIPTSTSVTPVPAKGSSLKTLLTEREEAVYEALRLSNPSFQPGEFNSLKGMVTQALTKQLSSNNTYGRDNAVGYAQPFSVRPIMVGDQVAGAMVVTATKPSGKIQVFRTTVGLAVGGAALAIALLAALVTVIFSRTITRPLAKLTDATRRLAAGEYDTQVPTKAAGELGELSHNFNDMAQQLKQDMEKLQEQEIWRRQLIMNITHDLATPLTAIAGLGEALVDGINQSRDDYEATGRVIVRETLRLRRLVQDLHIMAKVEAGALQPKKKMLRLATLADEVLAVLASEFERRQVEPNNAISYMLPLVEADPDMLMRVLSNLCSNSLRYTPKGGTVTIEAMLQKEQERILVAVTDTGEGIPPEALTRIFERFYRADSARQSSTGGSGLGLAIVRAIVEAHHGVVWAENVAGAGARIIFSLPVNPERGYDPSEGTTAPLRRARRS